MPKLNAQFIKNMNTVLKAIGLNPLNQTDEITALSELLNATIGEITRRLRIESSITDKTETPAETTADSDVKPEKKPRFKKRAKTPSSGKKSPFEYWNARIKQETSELSSDEYAQLKQYLSEMNAFYSRNSTEKQLKRTFAIIKSWKEKRNSSDMDEDIPF